MRLSAILLRLVSKGPRESFRLCSAGQIIKYERMTGGHDCTHTHVCDAKRDHACFFTAGPHHARHRRCDPPGRCGLCFAAIYVHLSYTMRGAERGKQTNARAFDVYIYIYIHMYLWHPRATGIDIVCCARACFYIESSHKYSPTRTCSSRMAIFGKIHTNMCINFSVASALAFSAINVQPCINR